MKTFLLTAHVRQNTSLENPILAEYFKLTHDFELIPPTRGDGAETPLTEIEQGVSNDEIVELITEQDVTWIGFLDDVGEALEDEQASASRGESLSEDSDVFRIPTAIPVRGSRGGYGDIVNKGLRILTGKLRGDVLEPIARDLGSRVDDKACPQPGLFRISKTGKLEPLGEIAPTDAPWLLFIHGTISSFDGGFGEIPEAEWKKLHTQYNGQLLAFNHRTITESPVRNALDLLTALSPVIKAKLEVETDMAKVPLQLDLITHSRGGLVGDVLARCDARISKNDRGYSDNDVRQIQADFEDDDQGRLNILYQEDYASTSKHLSSEMQEINTLVRSKSSFEIRRIVRVASPSAGTELLSRRLDHYLNAAFNLIKVAAKTIPFLGGLLNVVEAFVVAVVNERRDPRSFPGLYAMVPDLAFDRIHNGTAIRLPSTLISIAGDSEAGGTFRQTLKVLLTNLYYREPNDFVVDTNSMSQGAPFRAEHYHVLIKNAVVDHFAYFRIPEHLEVVSSLLVSDQPETVTFGGQMRVVNLNVKHSASRGVIIDKAYDPGKLYPKDDAISGSRPIVMLLPGIMGSNLYVANKAGKKEPKWVDLSALMNGALSDDLAYDENNTSVTADSIIDEFYGGFAERLTNKGNDVCIFPYDWRLPLDKSAEKLYDKLQELAEFNQPIQIVAHSMGGLVVRQLMLDQNVFWRKLRDNYATRIILLGTPWRGSHLVTEVLTGHSSRIKQLHRIDLRHSKRDTLNTVQAFPGLLSLLPLDDRKLRTSAEWERLGRASGYRVPTLPDSSVELIERTFSDLDERLIINPGVQDDDENGLLNDKDYKAIIYVAGYHPETVDGYFYRDKAFWRRKVLEYTTTPLGDGSVTWKRGIPKHVPASQVYYVRAQHGNLAANPALWPGLVKLVESGKTSHTAFAKTPPAVLVGSRGLQTLLPARAAIISKPAVQSTIESLFGITPEVAEPATQPVLVEVFNGDLKWAQFPVLVGHFDQLGLVSAERAVDRYLGGVLNERYMMGFYPGRIGEQEVIVDFDRRPRGAIVVGLGHKDSLTGSQLALTVRRGLVKYAMFRRDNMIEEREDPSGYGHGVSMLLVGTNFGELPMRESLRNLLAAVRSANTDIAGFVEIEGKPKLQPISRVEIVDFYEDRAYEAFRTLQDIVAREDLSDIVLADSLEEGFGRRKRFLRAAERGWWQTMTTRLETEKIRIKKKDRKDDPKAKKYYTEKHLRFDTYTRGTSVNTKDVYSNIDLAHMMARKMSQGTKDDKRRNNPTASKVLFELLIPNSYKDFIRNHRNIAWQMDIESAAFPWELFYDHETGPVPTFVRAGMVRRLYSEDAPLRPAFVRERSALIIADPFLDHKTLVNFRQLPGALAEGKVVKDKLSANKYDTLIHLEGARADEIINGLFKQPYKVVHIAAHGVFDEERRTKTGVVMEEGQRLTPGTFKQMSSVPEFVFINCCYSGHTDASAEKYMETRYRLAANIGTQLIKLGVRAVVVAGWEVSDDAAKVWAETFYDELLKGSYFGDSVRQARSICHGRFPEDNTWGAYQCYGDQFYRLAPEKQSETADEDELDLQQEILLELDNLVSRSRAIAYADKDQLKAVCKRASRLVARAMDLGDLSAKVRERKATLEYLLGNYSASAITYETLFNNDSGKYELDSYFQYINLLVRREVIGVLNLGRDTVKAYEKANEIYRRIKQLIAINVAGKVNSVKQGVNLLSVRGSTIKRLAALALLPKDVRATVMAAAALYLKAAGKKGKASPNSIYHYCSYIQLVALSASSARDAIKIVEAELKESPEVYFERWRNEIDYLAGGRDSPYASLRGANLMLTETLWKILLKNSGELKNPESLNLQLEADRLIARHRLQQESGFNVRDMRGQIEHYDLLLDIGRRLEVIESDQAMQLRRVRSWLHSRLVYPCGSWRNEVVAPGHSKNESPPKAPDGKGGDSSTSSGGNSEKSSGNPKNTTATGSSSTPPKDERSEFHIDTVSFDEPATTRGANVGAISFQIPLGASSALIEFIDVDGEVNLAWVPLEKNQTRGSSDLDAIVSGGKLILPIANESASRGGNGKLKKGIGNFLSRAKKGVVRFFKATKNFTDKEIRNRYEFQVFTLGTDGQLGAKSYDPRKQNGKDVERAFAKATEGQDQSLLMLHGMFNTAAGTFKDLLGKGNAPINRDFAQLLTQQYGGRAIVMNMPTIFRSFSHNAAQIPLDAIQCDTLDIMANSRGTNVARHLALKLEKRSMNLRGQIFLAGGPAFGTPLADAEHMLGFVNRITTLLHSAGRLTGPILDILAYLLKFATKKVLSGAGLVDMAPDSSTLKTLNDQWDFSASDTYFVGSNYTPDKKFKRLIDSQLIDKQIMKQNNDGIIPMKGTLGLRDDQNLKKNDPLRYRVPDDQSCGHFMYYKQKEVVQKLVEHLSNRNPII